MLTPLDVTVGLAAALCHFNQSDIGDEKVIYKIWKDFAKDNRKRIKGLKKKNSSRYFLSLPHE